MSKGKLTKENILKTAFHVASQDGLESLTIGELARHCSMSKSGLYAHFNSKENLQVTVIEYANLIFAQRVVEPARTKYSDDIEAKIRLLLENWLTWNHSFQGSCMFLDAWRSDAEEGNAIQKSLVAGIEKWLHYLEIQVEKAKEKNIFMVDLDAKQAVFQLYGAYLSSQLFYSVEGEQVSRERFWLSVNFLFDHWRK
ncbi:TetR family transcripitonal regulator [Vibrio nigripulchritudo ATCC 27043]|uniref:Putative Transcriptional regulator, TetR-like n=1 Tax=Vibrio nigripulchritudo TaxID=28173 RepID=U4KIU6_9VIBR|nr:TetR/AcrR family transcriptional regulator [Vibrio nigripulchritudo]EGU52953.1 TetR family transcripitonal regulator [Vibrio nigripulchritudo ATCC 27043]CCN81989.1 putative Transcriptional regulator, TetR-like [Vibrio nigripulchritudo BLFn1]CCN90451.1 putative Transcriptional regulator, TetR-like [Vibrio nigripulchritudo SFn27]CCN93774.1 putative Transcriptional regulator, TetR-like [Vibrio nigripulchritudo ENn2]CCO42803.1 putative Transcriptional regulator, TetR-like [Vibrio nigripulchritu